MPSMRRTLRRSPAVTVTSRPRRRLRAGVFFSSMWFSLVCRRSSLPVLVTWKRRAAPRWLFILGTGSPGDQVMSCGAGGGPPGGRRRGLGAALGLAGREHRDHVAPVLAGRAVGLGDLGGGGGPAGRAVWGPAWVLGGENTVFLLRRSWGSGLSPGAISARSTASRSSSRRPS